MSELEAAPVGAPSATTDICCITQDEEEPAGEAFLLVCDNNPVDIIASKYCAPECGGHPICGPCLALAREVGLAQCL